MAARTGNPLQHNRYVKKRANMPQIVLTTD